MRLVQGVTKMFQKIECTALPLKVILIENLILVVQHSSD